MEELRKPVLQGVHIDVSFLITRLGLPENFQDVEFIEARFVYKQLPNIMVVYDSSKITVSDNRVSVIIPDTDSTRLIIGDYDLHFLYKKTNVLRPNLYEPFRLVLPAFKLVKTTAELGGVVPTDLEVQSVEIQGELFIARDGLNGASAFQIWQMAVGTPQSTELEYLAWLRLPVDSAATDFDDLTVQFNTFNQSANEAEELRNTKEGQRDEAEGTRLVDEQLRKNAEQARVTAEQARALAELAREQAEADRETFFDQSVGESVAATNAANAAANAQNAYNVTVAVPLSAGIYYTKTTARSAVPVVSRKLGLVNTYALSASTWYTEKFIGSNVSGWTTESNWEQVPDAAKLATLETDLNESKITLSELPFEKSKNLFDKNKVTAGIMVSGTGIINTNSLVYVSDFIEFTEGQIGSWSGNSYNGAVCYFKEDKTWLSTPGASNTLTAPSGCFYMRKNIVNSADRAATLSSELIMFELSAIPTIYSPYGGVFKEDYKIPLTNSPIAAGYNIVSNNIFINGISGWDEVDIHNTNNVIKTIEPISHAFGSKSLKGLSTTSTASAALFGRVFNIGQYFKSGDVVAFSGLVRKETAAASYITIRCQTDSWTILLEVPQINISTSGIWQEVYKEFTIPENTTKINIMIRNINLGEYALLAAWNLRKKVTGILRDYEINATDLNESKITKVYYVSKTGSDNNTGGEIDPFYTLLKATSTIGNNDASIIIEEGDYREPLNLSACVSNNINIAARINKKVRILGSEKISGYVLVSGKTNVYEASYSGVIPTEKQIIYEDGRSSMPIEETERHANQKSLAYRLPYTKITSIAFNTNLATTLDSLDGEAGKYYYDSTNSKLYLHTTDSSNPETNGFSYENAKRLNITPPTSYSTSKLSLTNLEFCFSSGYGLNVSTFGQVARTLVAVLGAVDDGIKDSYNFVVSYQDEIADTRDGCNGHYNGLPDWNVSDGRSLPSAIYFHQWSHDNSDDGNSHHEKGNVKTIGGLYEYNGKSGIAPSNTCQWVDIYSICRNNGGNPNYPNYGEGVEVINSVLVGDEGIGCTFTGFGTICENNLRGFATQLATTTRLYLYNCVSRNNSVAEYFANFGRIYAYNCKVTNSDPSKYKVVSNSGEIIINNDTELV